MFGSVAKLKQECNFANKVFRDTFQIGFKIKRNEMNTKPFKDSADRFHEISRWLWILLPDIRKNMY